VVISLCEMRAGGDARASRTRKLFNPDPAARPAAVQVELLWSSRSRRWTLQGVPSLPDVVDK